MLISGTSVYCQNTGILICGASGVGKSALALRLIEQGGCLISDDQTSVAVQDNKLLATAPQTLSGLIEVRGIGILSDCPHTKMPVPLSGVIFLVTEEPERLPKEKTIQINGISLPCFSLRKDDFALTTKVNVVISILSGKQRLLRD